MLLHLNKAFIGDLRGSYNDCDRLSFNQRKPLKSPYFASYGYSVIMVFNKVQWTMFGKTMQLALPNISFLY